MALPEALHDRSWTDALTGASLDAGDGLRVGDLPLPWAALVRGMASDDE